MNYWVKLSAGLGVIGLLVGVWYADEHFTQQEAEEKKIAGKALHFEEGDLREIELWKGEEKFHFERLEAKSDWIMVAPDPAIAVDQDAVNNFVAAVQGVRRERTLSEGENTDLASFGLTEARRRIKVSLEGGETKELLIGGDVKIGQTQGSAFKALSVYAKLGESESIFTVPSAALSSTDRSFKDFRTKQVVSFKQEEITSFEFTVDGDSVTISQDGPGWQMKLASGKTYPGDSNNIGLYLDRIERLRADSVIEKPEQTIEKMTELGLNPPARVVSFKNEKGDTLHLLQVAVTKTQTNVTMIDGGVAQMSVEQFTELAPDVQYFRDLKVMRGVDMAQVSHLRTGSGKLFQKSGTKWYPVDSEGKTEAKTEVSGEAAEGEEAPTEEPSSRSEVATLVSDFEFMRAQSVIDPENAKDDSAYGLDQPIQTFSFEFSADSDMEKVQVRVGNRVENDEKNIYMKRDGSDAVYIIETTWMDALQALEKDPQAIDENKEVSPQAKKEE